MEHAEFIDEFANIYGQLNQIHPFREGNGRTLQLIMSEMAKEAGYEVNYGMASKDDWNRTFEYDTLDNNEESLKNNVRDNTELEELFATITKPNKR